jgi:hypothetical protein
VTSHGVVLLGRQKLQDFARSGRRRGWVLSYCYRHDDKVVWQEFGQWWGDVVSCGDYLLELEAAVGWANHLLFSRNRIVVRRISDGVPAGSIKTRPMKNGVPGSVVCASP